MTDTKAHTAAPAHEDPAASLAAKRVQLAPWDVYVGPFAHLDPERTRLDGCTYEGFNVTPLGVTIGAEISGVTISDDLDDAVISELWRCLIDYKVLFFRNQPISTAAHVAFASRFGSLEVHPFIPSNTDQPELVRFEKHATVGGYENGWHSDVSWRATPSAAAILHACEIPRVGGDTLFSDMYAAYEGLDDAMKSRIDGLVAVHDFAKAFGHNLSPGDKAAMREQFPVVEHPVVRTHPESGRKLIYVNRYFVDHIVGLDPAESDALIDTLSRQAEIVEYQCRFRWEQDSVAFWDNRAVQHYASSDYWPRRRVMERASIIGDRPF